MAIYRKCALFHLVIAVVAVSAKPPETPDPCPAGAATSRSSLNRSEIDQMLYDRHVQYKPQAVILRDTLYNADGTSQVNETAIIDVFADKDVFSCEHIKDAYWECYGEELLDVFREKLNPKIRELMLALTSKWHDYYAEKLHEMALNGTIDNDTIIDIFATQGIETLCFLKKAYWRAYNESLKSLMERITTGEFRRLLVSILSVGCSHGGERRDTINDAQDLHNADPNQKEKIVSLINTIFTSPESDLYVTIRKYERISKRRFEDKIRENFSDNTEKLLLAIVQHVRNDREFYAKKLHASVNGRMDYRVIDMFFVNEHRLNRERYMETFEKLYGKPFLSYIPVDSSDNYYYALRLLIADALKEEEEESAV